MSQSEVGLETSPSTAEVIHLTDFDTALGSFSLASTPEGVVRCSLPGERQIHVRRWLRQHLPGLPLEEGRGRNGPAVRAVQDFLGGRRRELDLPLDLRGTPFQLDVWRTLRGVDYGETIAYGELAARAGHPGADRACGVAAGANPLPLFVPCHRVVAADGSLGGFTGSLPLKQKLLRLENGPFSLRN